MRSTKEGDYRESVDTSIVVIVNILVPSSPRSDVA